MMQCRVMYRRGAPLCSAFGQCGTRTYTRSASLDYYQLLGVRRNASLEEIKNAFFTQSKKLHPDRDPSNPLLHSQFVQLNEAYKVLSKENSRRQYDQLLWALQRDNWVPGGHSTYHRNWESNSRSASEDKARYWSQFTVRQKASSGNWKGRNKRLVWYCVLIMTGSMIMHYVGFRTLRDIHQGFMEEQNQRILKIYNEAKERARENGFRKQQEILRQKHAEFTAKYRGGNEGNETKR